MIDVLLAMIGDFFRITPKSRKVRLRQKKGILFSNPGGWNRTFFYVGTFALLSACIYLVYLYTPISIALIRYKTESGQGEKNVENIPSESTEVKSDRYTISIPKIYAFSDIVADVSPYDQVKYQKVLEENVVAQAANSDEPGQGKGKMTYIFAHSTSQSLVMLRKNAVFYLLGDLVNDDLVVINNKGKILSYKVYMKKIVLPSETDFLTYTDQEKEVLILQTCWPIGTNWRRLLVFAEKIES